MKTKTLSIQNIFKLLTFCIFIIPIGCNKDNSFKQELSEKSNSIELLKEDFFRLEYNKKLISKIDDTTNLEWQPQWNKPEYKNKDSSNYVYIRLVPKLVFKNGRSSTTKITDFGRSRFLLVINKNKINEYVLATYLNSSTSQFKTTFDSKTFSGTSYYEMLGKSQTFYIEYKNGLRINPSNQDNNKIISDSNISSDLTFQCFKTYDCTWSTSCASGGLYVLYKKGDMNGCTVPNNPGDAIGCLPGTYTWQLTEIRDGVPICRWVDTSEPPLPPTLPPFPPLPGGGNGNPNISIVASDLLNARPIDNGTPKITDIKKYTKCFNDGKAAIKYTMTIYAAQPVPGTSSWYKIVQPGVSTNPLGIPTGIIWTRADGTWFDVGHTFVSFEKNNVDGTVVRQTLGYYPSHDPVSSKGVIKDDGGHHADVSYKITVSKTQFEAALQKMENDFANSQYTLHNINSTEYNCTDAAVSWMNEAGAGIENSTYGLFRNTPGNLGQILRNKPSADTNPENGPIGKGPCN